MTSNSAGNTAPPVENVQTAPQAGKFTLQQRLALWLISWLGFLSIQLICSTLRWSVSAEDDGPTDDSDGPVVSPFWHRCIFLAAYMYRKRGIAVMTSSSFDGEYIARIIERLGFRAVRGSSTRGGAGALLALHDQIKTGHTVAFTIDGPKGPRYVAKRGPVLLARNTQAAILGFYITVDRAWVLKTWDALIIPKPFAHAVIRIAKPIRVPEDAGPDVMERFHAEMQASLERIRDDAETRAARTD
jgi:lysophospholipid acyltransferase (LPLAT)-like uncharacterized protein